MPKQDHDQEPKPKPAPAPKPSTADDTVPETPPSGDGDKGDGGEQG